MLCQGRLIINGVDCSYNGERPGTRSKQAGQFSLTTRTLSLSLARAAMEESPLPNVCLSVSIPMTGFSFAYLPARGPANTVTVAYSQYVPLYNLRHSVFALRVRDDGSGGGGKGIK